MAAVGGDILEITYNHPTVGSGVFFPKSGEDSTFDPGGFRVNDDANGIDGGGQMIKQMNRVRWSFEATISSDMNSAQEMEKLAALAASPADAEFTISHINGTIYKGTGTVVGDIQPNGNAATSTIKLSGGGQLLQL